VSPPAGIQVRIVLPPGVDLSGTEAVYRSPDLSGEEPTPLPLARQDGAVEVTVPELLIYGVLEIPVGG
jgi:hypothetical protein